MENEENPIGVKPSDMAIYERFSLMWVVSLFISYLLAISGFFTRTNSFFLLAFCGIGTIALLWKLRPSKEFILLGGVFFLFVVVISFPSTPSIFSGRDQGSYSGAAIRLAEEHALFSKTPAIAKDFFALHGAGQALNFPGFFYTNNGTLTTQFPIGYISWLSENFSLFGFIGLSLANAFTLFLTFISIFLFIRNFLTLPFAIGGSVVAMLSFPFLWLVNNTLSENLAVALFLLISVHIVSFLQKPTLLSWWLIISGSVFFCLTRVEGFFILGAVILITLLNAHSREYLKKTLQTTLIPSAIFVGIFLLLNIAFNLPFYRAIGKALLKSSETSTEISSVFSFFDPIVRNFGLFWTYGMIPVFSITLLGMIFLFQKRAFLKLIPFFLALPTFFYLISPHISPDHPWMLRRFIFSIWPTAIILALFGIERIYVHFSKKFPAGILSNQKVFLFLFASLLIIPSLPASIPVLLSSENSLLLKNVEELSKTFSPKDLILVDQLASGDPYTMIADPMSTLFGLNAVYFFNPSDLEKINISRFDHVYLLAPDATVDRYKSGLGEKYDLLPARSYSLQSSGISRETNPFKLPSIQSRTAHGTIFLITPKNT